MTTGDKGIKKGKIEHVFKGLYGDVEMPLADRLEIAEYGKDGSLKWLIVVNNRKIPSGKVDAFATGVQKVINDIESDTD